MLEPKIMKKAFSLLILLLICEPVWADIILLKNGEKVEGKIKEVRGIFLRVESDYKQPFREFLMENVASIEITKANVVNQYAIQSLHNRTIGKVREMKLQEVIDRKASTLIEEAIQKAEGLTLDKISDEGKIAAAQKANILIEEAVISADTPPLANVAPEVRGGPHGQSLHPPRSRVDRRPP